MLTLRMRRCFSAALEFIPYRLKGRNTYLYKPRRTPTPKPAPPKKALARIDGEPTPRWWLDATAELLGGIQEYESLTAFKVVRVQGLFWDLAVSLGFVGLGSWVWFRAESRLQDLRLCILKLGWALDTCDDVAWPLMLKAGFLGVYLSDSLWTSLI